MKGSISYSMDQSNRLYLNITWTRLSIQPVNSVIQSFPTCCNPMDCSTPGFPAHHQPLELKLMSIELVMSPNHLILCRPLLLLPLIFPSIRIFSVESVLHIRWPKNWSFSFNISPSNEYSGLISCRIDWFDLPAVQGTLKSPFQQHSSKASIIQWRLDITFTILSNCLFTEFF